MSGYSNEYIDYLGSDKWQSRRKALIEQAEGKCQLCGDDDTVLHLHHKTYKRLGNEDSGDLIVVCRGCHWILDEARKGNRDIINRYKKRIEKSKRQAIHEHKQRVEFVQSIKRKTKLDSKVETFIEQLSNKVIYLDSANNKAQTKLEIVEEKLKHAIRERKEAEEKLLFYQAKCLRLEAIND